MRIHTGASRVKRIGHGVMAAPNVRDTARWFRETLGFICSDDVYAGSKDNIIGSFNRCDRGAKYVDHHVFFCIRNEKAGLNHLSFEVADIDDVFTGHEYLTRLGKYEHMWGIGRHLLGSQIYDYWADPWGRVHEHWSDTDRLNVKNGSNLLSAEAGLVSHGGDRPAGKVIPRARRRARGVRRRPRGGRARDDARARRARGEEAPHLFRRRGGVALRAGPRDDRAVRARHGDVAPHAPGRREHVRLPVRQDALHHERRGRGDAARSADVHPDRRPPPPALPGSRGPDLPRVPHPPPAPPPPRL